MTVDARPPNDSIWVYWEGPRPGYIALCLETITHHNAHVALLDRSAFDALFVNDRDIKIDELALNHKSDFIRAYLLKHYGGLYLDADCIVMRDLSSLLELAYDQGFVGYREPQGYMSCNFMASRPKGEVISEHYAAVCATLRDRRGLEWLDLATVPMEAAVAHHPDQSWLLETESIMPVNWSESERLCVRRSDADHAPHLQSDAYCYMLSNNTIRSQDQTRMVLYMTENDILRDQSFLGFLFRTSLGREGTVMHDTPPHLGGHEDKTQFDEGAFDYLAARFGVRSMIDIGCGPGGMVYYARSKGIRAIGVDGDPSIARGSAVMIEHDYARGPLFLGEFDLAWSVEFVEHVDEEFIPHFMATFGACKHAFITAAIPGQLGHYHVNCQWGDYWIARFAEVGFVLDEEATAGVRSHSTMWSRFTEQTGLVFNRVED